MRKSALSLALFMLVASVGISVGAQDSSRPPDSARTAEAVKPAAHFYRLDFVLAELDAAGKPVNSRAFSTIVSTGGTRSGSFTVGTKVPILTGPYDPKGESKALPPQFQYIDIGVKAVIRDVHEDGSRLAFSLRAEVSSMATPKVLNGVSEPVLRQNVWDGDVLIPIGKITPAFKSDSLDDKGTMQLDVKATPME